MTSSNTNWIPRSTKVDARAAEIFWAVTTSGDIIPVRWMAWGKGKFQTLEGKNEGMYGFGVTHYQPIVKPEYTAPIQPCEVVRNSYGMFTHPDFPAWHEGTHRDTVADWFTFNKGTRHVVHFDDTAPDLLFKAWLHNGGCDLSKWEPSCAANNSFLLSIHDTENGPVAWFFVPNA